MLLFEQSLFFTSALSKGGSRISHSGRTGGSQTVLMGFDGHWGHFKVFKGWWGL